MAWIHTPEAVTKLTDLLLKGNYFYTFDGIPLKARKLSFKKRANLILAGLDMMLGKKHCLSLPPVIQIEPTNMCNLKCPLCPTGSGTLSRPKGMMTFDTFERVLDELGDSLISIYFFCFGEPFLHKDLPRMIEASTRKNVLSLISTNGHFIQTPEAARAVVDAGLHVLIIAMDGSTQDVYRAYRKNGDLEKVKRCAALIRDAKIKRGAEYPYTVIRTVATHENEKDLPNIERLAAELGADMFSYKSVGCMVDVPDYSRFVPEEARMRRFDGSRENDIGRQDICPFPFRQPVVFWDGSIVGCEYDHDMSFKFGGISEDGFRKSWNSQNAIDLRKSILTRSNHAAFCIERCPYRNRQSDSANLYCKEFLR